MPVVQLGETLERELGSGWRRHVREFDETPVAAASIGQALQQQSAHNNNVAPPHDQHNNDSAGQVHRATLTDGRAVAIKVQYPGVAASIESDLWSVKQLISLTGMAPRGMYVDNVIKVCCCAGRRCCCAGATCTCTLCPRLHNNSERSQQQQQRDHNNDAGGSGRARDRMRLRPRGRERHAVQADALAISGVHRSCCRARPVLLGRTDDGVGARRGVEPV